eukprot:1339673-Amorphochlora_amoeboformis.AAC.1
MNTCAYIVVIMYTYTQFCAKHRIIHLSVFRSENSGNEINGITLAGVGSSTTLELCEVAWNNDDGFEFFGGTVNARWLSSIYNKGESNTLLLSEDDAFDVDEGYQGSMQFLFGLVDFE